MTSPPELERLIAADEDARARVEAVRADQTQRREMAVRAHEERAIEQRHALETALAADIAAIERETEALVAQRREAREVRRQRVTDASNRLFERAVQSWIRIVEEGPVP